MRHPRFSSSLLLLVLSWALVASGDEASEAGFFAARARSARAAGRAEEALANQLLAAEVVPSSRNLFLLGVLAQAARRPAMAYSYFEEYLGRRDAVEAARAEALSQTRRLARSLALIEIRSEPAGATVFVDRRECGSFGRTPRTIALEGATSRGRTGDLTPCGVLPATGPVRLTLVADGFLDANLELEARVGERTLGEVIRLSPRMGGLRAPDEPGAVFVASAVGGRTIELRSGQEVPAPVGSYRVRAQAPGHEEASGEVTVVEGHTTAIDLRLRRVAPVTSWIEVTSDPPGATVLVDGVRTATTPARASVVVGSHNLRVEASGYLPWSGEVTAVARTTVHHSVTLVPRSRSSATHATR